MNKKQINDIWDQLHDIQVKITQINYRVQKERRALKKRYWDLLECNGEVLGDLTKVMDILGAELED